MPLMSEYTLGREKGKQTHRMSKSKSMEGKNSPGAGGNCNQAVCIGAKCPEE